MAIDDSKRQQVLEQAEDLLRERYAQGRPYFDPMQVMQTVRAQACGRDLLQGEEAPEVPAEDLLAALTQMAEARERLDALERDLIRSARARSASWQKIADALGLANRQAAEARATRLERAAQSLSQDRDVRTQRRERARQRAVAAWGRTHEARVRSVCEQLVDVAPSWPQLPTTEAGAYALRGLDGALKGNADVPRLIAALDSLCSHLGPYGGPALEPHGGRAAEAVQVRHAAVELLGEVTAVGAAVDESRLSTKR